MFLSSFWYEYIIMLKAIAKTSTSPLGMLFKYPLFSKNKNADSKNLGNIYKASSVRLLAGSKRTANEQMNAAKITFHLSVLSRLFLNTQQKYQNDDTYTEINKDDMIML